MAGDWIKFEVATSDKPEVWAIAGTLGIDPDAVVGKLLRVWAWFDQHTTEGNAPSVTSALLDRCVGVTGFCKAVTQAGWMIDDGVTLSLPNFDTHNGETAKKRCQTAKRVAKHKKSNAQGNAQVTQPPLPTALPREDNREDIINQSSNNNTPAEIAARRGEFVMFKDWTPNSLTEFDDRLKVAGILITTETWLNALPEFIGYWMGRPEVARNQAGWENTFLKNLKRLQVGMAVA